MIITR